MWGVFCRPIAVVAHRKPDGKRHTGITWINQPVIPDARSCKIRIAFLLKLLAGHRFHHFNSGAVWLLAALLVAAGAMSGRKT